MKSDTFSYSKDCLAQILITETIAAEFGSPLPDWFQIRKPSDATHQEILQTSLDAGEASAIALALDLRDCLLITDDWKARRLATKLGIRITGTVGVLLDAKRFGHIREIKPLLELMKRAKFRMSDELIAKTLRLAGEE
ncbi:MAG: DUF3368 domain-containing protein [Ignavibacteriae bacterium]|nr:DUF3368 domain-containing protein [Ignavibacteriota bacterium]